MTKPSRRRSNGREMPVSDSASSEANAARDSGVSAASPPPVTTASASPCWIIRVAAPIEFAPAAQADTTPKVWPSSPWRIETWPASALPIMSGTVSGDTRFGAAIAQRVVLLLDRREPADAGPDDAADAVGVVRQPVGPSPRRRAPRSDAAMPSWVNRSARRASFGVMVSVGSNSAQAPSPSRMPDSPAAQRCEQVVRATRAG